MYLALQLNTSDAMCRCSTVKKRHVYNLPRTCFAVSLSFGSGWSICRTRSLALSETLGQGSRLKSIFPRRIACATPCSVSAKFAWYDHLHKINTDGQNVLRNEKWIVQNWSKVVNRESKCFSLTLNSRQCLEVDIFLMASARQQLLADFDS